MFRCEDLCYLQGAMKIPDSVVTRKLIPATEIILSLIQPDVDDSRGGDAFTLVAVEF